MSDFSIWHWAIVFGYILFFATPLWLVVKKTGLHPALSLLFHVPLVNLAALWWLALAKWPSITAHGDFWEGEKSQ